MSTKEISAVSAIVEAVIATVTKQGGVRLVSLKNELKAKDATLVLKTDDIVAFGEDGYPIGLTADYMESLTFIAYHKPLADGATAEDIKKAIRIFLAPAGTEFLSDDEDDGLGEDAELTGHPDIGEEVGLPNGAVDFFLVMEGDDFHQAATTTDALGLAFKLAGEGKRASIYAAVPVEMDYKLTVAERVSDALVDQQAAAALEATDDDDGVEEEGDES
jgi:hypothetical protein